MSPRISIAMAAFNGEKYIGEQLESFGKQTVPPDEVIVSDDASSDRTVEIIEAFKEHARFEIVLLRNKSRIGYTPNFGRAISQCTGDVIFISDQDDVWFPDKLQIVREVIEKNRAIHCVVNDMELTDGSLKPSGVTQLTLARRLGVPGTQMAAGCGMAITRHWRNFILPFPSRIPYDSWIGGLAQRLGVFHLLEHRLQYYRRHGANTTNPITAAERQRDAWLSQVNARRAPFHPYFIKWFKGEAPHNFEGAHRSLAVMLERLKEARSKRQLDFISENSVALAIQTLERELKLVERRAEILARPRLVRIYPVMSLLLSGEYELASGALSAIKDIVGPRRAVGVRTSSPLS
jgi:glycosyltransferase involved in cell wall biosynthesis